MEKRLSPFAGPIVIPDDYLTTSKTHVDCLDEMLQDHPDLLPYIATLNTYRIDQLLLAFLRGRPIANIKSESYYIRYAGARLTEENLKFYLGVKGYPRLEDYIEPINTEDHL